MNAVPSQTGSSQTTALQDRIRNDVIYGRLAPGAKLKVEALQERYSAGATPLREALSLLVSSGLVERQEQRGFRVAKVSMQDFEEILWTRCFIEERALRESIAKGGQDWEGRIVLALHHLRGFPLTASFADEVEEQRWEKVHAEFHAALISACPSRVLLRYCGQLYDANRRYRHIARLTPNARGNSLSEHEQLGEAVLARDAERAAQILVQHYTRTGQLLRSHISTYKQTA